MEALTVSCYMLSNKDMEFTVADSKTGKLGKFHRVQTSSRDAKTGAFVTRNSSSGKVTVTLSREAYRSAKSAASRAMNKKKQPA